VFVYDIGLGGHPDENVMSRAWRDKRIVLTHDRDFLDDRRFPPHRNPGVIVLPGAQGCTPVLEWELARVVVADGRHGDVFRGYKIHILEDGTWSIRPPHSPIGLRGTRLLKFDRRGEIWECDWRV
jgi:hypothetical protein